MSRLAEIEGHIASMSELLDIVSAMRSLAGMQVREAQRALPGIRRFAESIEAAVSTALAFTPAPPRDGRGARRRGALILFTAEHGFVGGFAERLVEAAQATIGLHTTLFVMGTRGSLLAVERGC